MPLGNMYFCSKYNAMEFSAYTFSSEALQHRIKNILAVSSSSDELKPVLSRLFGFIDFTTLEATDNETSIAAFCKRALSYQQAGYAVAALCIYSPFVKQVKKALEGSGISVATVACGFPSGQMPLKLKLDEVQFAVESGADDVDMVISRGKFLQGNYQEVFEEIQAVKAQCGDAHLKVILETGELKTVANIRKASELALLAGADFLKTSTGKVQPAATTEAAMIMLDTIREFFDKTGKKVGFKPAGGIADPLIAYQYMQLLKAVLGDEWLQKSLFRIGASRLADKVLEQLKD
jgi:deoxyribose-phosphate aldolase